MTRTLYAHWSEFGSAVDHILSIARERLLVFDFDLSAMKFNTPDHHRAIQSLLTNNPQNKSVFIVQDASRLTLEQPRVISLLDRFQHNLGILECPESLRELPDSMIIADDKHALIRFHRQQPRCKLLEDESEEVFPYRRRFDEILAEGGTWVSARACGL